MNRNIFSLIFCLWVMANSNWAQEHSANLEDIPKPLTLEFGPMNEVSAYLKGDTVFIPCQAKAEHPSDSPRASWTKNGEKVNSSIHYRIGLNPTQNKHGLTITAFGKDDSGRYQCFVSNQQNTSVVTSNSTEIRLFEFEERRTINVTAKEGEAFHLDCKLPENLPNEEHYWIERSSENKINAKEEEDAERQIISVDNGSLWFSSVSRKDASSSRRPYYTYLFSDKNKKIHEICKTTLMVVNASESGGSEATEPTKQYVSEESQIVEENGLVKLFCIYGANPSPTITWTKDGIELQSTSQKNVQVAMSKKFITIKGFKPENSGKYNCKVERDGTEYGSHNFSVKIGKPYFTNEGKPNDNVTYEGGPISFVCGAADGDPEFNLEIEWIYNGKPINESNFNDDYVIDTQNGTSTLSFAKTERKHIGNYGCNASNAHGYVFEGVTLTLKPAQPVKLTDESLANVTVFVQRNGTFNWTCPLYGVPSPTIKFMKGDEVLTIGDRVTLKVSKEEHTLEIRNFNSEDEGTYVCNGKNGEKNPSINATINVFIDNRGSGDAQVKPESGFNYSILFIILAGLSLAAVAIIAWRWYDKHHVDGIYRVKDRETAVEQNPKIMDEENETLMSPNAATLNRVRKTNESTRNGSVTVQMEPKD